MVGRPSIMTDGVLAKLEDAFSLGHTDEEACLYAEIDHSTLYRYCQENPNFARKKELLKHHMVLIARRNVAMKIKEGNVELSKWYLERKMREEFGTKENVEILMKEERAKWENEKKMKEIDNYIYKMLEHKEGDPPIGPPPTALHEMSHAHRNNTDLTDQE